MHSLLGKKSPEDSYLQHFHGEILRNYDGKNHGLVHGILEELLSLRKALRGRGWEGEGEGRTLALLLTSLCAIPARNTVWTPGTNLSIDKHVHGHNYARGTNRTAIRSRFKTNILATCNDCMFNKELDRFTQSFSWVRQNRTSKSQALAAGCKEVGTVRNGGSLGFWELFVHPNIKVPRKDTSDSVLLETFLRNSRGSYPFLNKKFKGLSRNFKWTHFPFFNDFIQC